MLSLLHGPALTLIHDHWKDHSFDYEWIFNSSDLCCLKSLRPRLLSCVWGGRWTTWARKACVMPGSHQRYFGYFPRGSPWATSPLQTCLSAKGTWGEWSVVFTPLAGTWGVSGRKSQSGAWSSMPFLPSGLPGIGTMSGSGSLGHRP